MYFSVGRERAICGFLCLYLSFSICNVCVLAKELLPLHVPVHCVNFFLSEISIKATRARQVSLFVHVCTMHDLCTACSYLFRGRQTYMHVNL